MTSFSCLLLTVWGSLFTAPFNVFFHSILELELFFPTFQPSNLLALRKTRQRQRPPNALDRMPLKPHSYKQVSVPVSSLLIPCVGDCDCDCDVDGDGG